jgi:hypothetical protein
LLELLCFLFALLVYFREFVLAFALERLVFSGGGARGANVLEAALQLADLLVGLFQQGNVV